MIYDEMGLFILYLTVLDGTLVPSSLELDILGMFIFQLIDNQLFE